MKIAKRIAEGGRYPTGYGVAYFDFVSMGYVCFPVPFHVVVGVARRVWFAFLTLGIQSDPFMKAWAAGYGKASSENYKFRYDEGYQAGHKDGYDRAFHLIKIAQDAAK